MGLKVGRARRQLHLSLRVWNLQACGLSELLLVTVFTNLLPRLPGCSIGELWERLGARLPVSGLNALNDSVKRYVWTLILEHPQDVRVVVSRDAAAAR